MGTTEFRFDCCNCGKKYDMTIKVDDNLRKFFV